MTIIGHRDDSLPCLHGFERESVQHAKHLLENLDTEHPDLLRRAGINPDTWVLVLRATVESLRGVSAATGTDKRRFIKAVLDYGTAHGIFQSWTFIGSESRQDYRVTMHSGRQVGVEAKGCLDGNNTTIWDRPGWADEFVIWSLCPESMVNPPGHGAWSGISTRLMPKIVAERQRVEALIVWDGRCGSRMRRCPKQLGLRGSLRAEATDIVGQPKKNDWLPPPCIFMFPSGYPSIPSNPNPPLKPVKDVEFVSALLTMFGVPPGELENYVHDARVQARGTAQGTEIAVTVRSRCWEDGQDRLVEGRWKRVKRDT